MAKPCEDESEIDIQPADMQLEGDDIVSRPTTF
jgi:hypothetical protein